MKPPEEVEKMQVTPDTRISEVLKRYGDIADVMETFGVKRVGRYNFRRLLGKALTVRRAAFAHRISVEEMVHSLQSAIDKVHAEMSET
jgi:hypothetical protein